MKLDKCPECGSKELTIEEQEIDNDKKIAWVEVDCMDCEWYGTEVYSITFNHYEDKDGKAVVY